MAAQTKWQLSGDYFENCNCTVVCPCLVSPGAPLTARPSEGVCDVALAFHIDKGNYGDILGRHQHGYAGGYAYYAYGERGSAAPPAGP